MNFKHIFYTIQITMLLSCTCLFAQQVDTAYHDYDFAQKTNTWFLSNNAAGLVNYGSLDIATAWLTTAKSDGDFRNYHESNNSFAYGLNAKSIYRYSPSVVFKGGIAYQNFNGKNMGGATFIDPYKNALNIIEMDDSNRGGKHLENYNLDGSVGATLAPDLALGVGFNYQAANYAKDRDLRHVNKLGALDASLGLKYALADKISVGLNYKYDRRIESIVFRTFGNTDRVYNSLIDFGSFYGYSEVFNDYGFTASGNNTPYTDFGHELAFQVGAKLADGLDWFNEVSYREHDGYFGEKGTSTVMFTRHDGFNYGLKSSLSKKGTNHHQFLQLTAVYSDLSNFEQSYRPETVQGSVTRIVYYGETEVFAQSKLDAKLAYQLYLGLDENHLAKYVFDLSSNLLTYQQNTSVYPFYRKQQLTSYAVNLAATRNLKKNDYLYGLTAALGYGAGSGTLNADGLYTTPSASQTPAAGNDLYLNQEFEYFTKPRLNTMLGFKASKAYKNLRPYLGASYHFTKAFDVSYLGNNFSRASLTLGSNF